MAPSSFKPTSDNTGFDAKEVVQEIQEVKKEILKDKLKRNRRERDKRMMKMQSTSPLLLLAVGFAVGYIIAKK